MASLYSFLIYYFLFAVFSEGVWPKRHGHTKNNHHKIVGGYDTTIQDVPYQAYLVLSDGTDSYQCGGSIISSRHILTAAHCLADIQEIHVRVGSTYADKDGTVIEASSFKQHQDYNDKTFDYDIGVIELSQDIEIDGENTRVVELASEDSTVEPGTNILVSGWGTTSEDGDISETLMAVQVPTISNEDCSTMVGHITSRMICAGEPEGGKDSCQGDSGGPAVNEDGVQVGVVSFGVGCARPGRPGVYSNVAALRSWIKENSGV